MDEEERPPPKSLALDWNTLLDGDAPPPEILVTPSMSSDQPSAGDGLETLDDRTLRESIGSKKRTLEITGPKLIDGGAKLRVTIKRLEDELASRQMKHLQELEEVDEDDEPRQATPTNAAGVSNDLRQEDISSHVQLQSSFASCFVKKMEDDDSCKAVDAFKKEISHFKHCNNQTMRDNGEPKGRKRLLSSSRQLPFQCPSNISKRDTLNDDKSCRVSSTFSSGGKNLPRSFQKWKDASKEIQSDGTRSRKGQPIVLDDDDDEPHTLERTEQENKLAEYLKEAKIYYPSRDDPECVEICYPDTACLAPEGYLTSTIINFYIRYLKQQASVTKRSLSEYHFFNTYFYKKLKEAVSYKRSDRETFFVKFRRWWKGINIFQKAYVLIPIHEDLHWSLIIICIPDKEDESGPIILHLDSLGLHSSKSVFDNIKSYLIEEKNYLDRECVPSDVSIADRIWKCLPRRIEAQVITVPQQKNEYDCGLFVLYFIERFIEEAPKRLRKKDLAMFGKRWFKPEEASSLRPRIRKLLVAELEKSVRHNCTSESSPPSCDGTAAECVETAKDSLI